MFSHYGYLFLHSRQKRAGKTRTLELLSHLAFDATRPLNAPTPPSVRDLADEGHTVLLDTLERSREKNHESHAAMMELLDAGFRNGGTVVKQVKVRGEFRRREYQAYAPYAMAAIKKESLSDTALDRAFVIEAHRKPIRVKTKRYQFERCDADCAPIRETLYRWALQNGGKIAAHYDGPELDAKMDHLTLHDRANDIWRPLFAVASVLGVPEDTMHDLSTLAREMGGDPRPSKMRGSLRLFARSGSGRKMAT
jgi:hypothetical protein